MAAAHEHDHVRDEYDHRHGRDRPHRRLDGAEDRNERDERERDQGIRETELNDLTEPVQVVRRPRTGAAECDDQTGEAREAHAHGRDGEEETGLGDQPR